MFVSEIISIFAHDSGSPKGREGQDILKKDVYGRYLRLSDLANQSPEENATETSALGVLYPVHLILYRVDERIYSRRGLTRVAYPGQGNARARQWDKRKVVTPTSLILT